MKELQNYKCLTAAVCRVTLSAGIILFKMVKSIKNILITNFSIKRKKRVILYQ